MYWKEIWIQGTKLQIPFCCICSWKLFICFVYVYASFSKVIWLKSYLIHGASQRSLFSWEDTLVCAARHTILLNTFLDTSLKVILFSNLTLEEIIWKECYACLPGKKSMETGCISHITRDIRHVSKPSFPLL